MCVTPWAEANAFVDSSSPANGMVAGGLSKTHDVNHRRVNGAVLLFVINQPAAAHIQQRAEVASVSVYFARFLPQLSNLLTSR